MSKQSDSNEKTNLSEGDASLVVALVFIISLIGVVICIYSALKTTREATPAEITEFTQRSRCHSESMRDFLENRVPARLYDLEAISDECEAEATREAKSNAEAAVVLRQYQAIK